MPSRARRKRRGTVKFAGGTCVFSAWTTLVFSILFAIGSFITGASLSSYGAAAERARQMPPLTGGSTFPSQSGSPLGNLTPPFPMPRTEVDPDTGAQIPVADPNLGSSGSGLEGTSVGGSGMGGLGGGMLGGGPMGAPGAILPILAPIMSAAPMLCYASGILTLVSGIGLFLLFLGLGQTCYAVVEIEDQLERMDQNLQLLVNRMGRS